LLCRAGSKAISGNSHQACLSFRPSSSLRQQLHSAAMRPLARLEDERNSFALWYVGFRQSPK